MNSHSVSIIHLSFQLNISRVRLRDLIDRGVRVQTSNIYEKKES
jgi:hypothetical protein